MRTIVIDDTASEILESLALAELAAQSAALVNLNERTQPDSYTRARAAVVALCDVIAQLNGEGEPVPMPPPAPVDYGNLIAGSPEGVAYARDHGPHDPRAARPHCTHGVPFAEPCATCEGATRPTLGDIVGIIQAAHDDEDGRC